MLDYNNFYLYLIRHGQTVVNAQPDLMGQTADSPLNDTGRGQAARLGQRLFQKEKLDVSRVFCSTYTRAVDTCNIALGQSPTLLTVTPTFHHDLREYSAGDWTNASRSATHTPEVQRKMAAMTNQFCPPHGESMAMVERRAGQWLEDNVLYNEDVQREAFERYANKKPAQNILVFSHGMTIKCLLHYVMGFDSSFIWKVTTENTSINKLYFGKDGWRLLSINDHAHLL